MGKSDDIDFGELGSDEWFSDLGEPEYWMPAVETSTRLERRTEARASVKISAKIEPGGRPAMAADLSLGGVLVYTSRPVQAGSRVITRLTTEMASVEVVGVVRWVSNPPSNFSEPGKICMGIQFLWVSLGMRELLEG